ncbi:type IV secretory system conjugative DNA transfer family protein [Bifidobacterium breve]|uniref:type IV secretory system conjugative DNA transfer family protein n=1 Tax=Bifidobacterium breve TaxID=1685 RepID=UPI00374FDA15
MKRLQAILPAAMGLFTLFWLGDKIGYQIRTDLDEGTSVIDLMNRFWLDLYHPFHLSTNHTDLLCGIAAMGVGLLIWAYKYTARLNLRSGEEHGSAHWGAPKDIKPFIDPVESHNIRFTATERLSIDTRRTLRNLNALLLGSSGSGKTRYYVKPNLLSVDMNWTVTDPKGELKRDTEHAMRDRGYQVNTLDLIHLDRSDQFNPMRYIDSKEPQSAILRLTDNLVTNATGDRKTGDSFWQDAEKALLCALIAWTYYTENNPTLNQVTDTLDRMGASEQDEDKEYIIDALFAGTPAEKRRVHRLPDTLALLNQN